MFIQYIAEGFDTNIPLIQVKWGKDDIDGYLNFYSISGDGRVSNWTIVKTAMWHTDVLNIGFERRLKNFDCQENLFKGIQ